MIRVAIAEEQRIPRWALAEALGKTAELEIVGQAGTVEETLDMVRTMKPEVLVLDTTIPDHSGFDVLARLRDIEAGPLVVVLAPLTEPAYAARAISAGAHGYVAKSADPDELIEAIRAVTRGEQVIPPGVDKLLAAGDGQVASALTTREIQVMEMLARGMTNREIAHDLDISVKTVDTHRGHVLKKLAVRNNAELARFAVKHGYVTL
jgi:DNA-binding NarL/FixJ family response regulator